MKKFTLTLIAALFMTVGAFAQEAEASLRIQNEAKSQIVTETNTFKKLDGVTLHKKVSRRGSPVTSYYAAAGAYKWSYKIANTYSITPSPTTGTTYKSTCTITDDDPSQGTIIISGLTYASTNWVLNPLKAKVDADGYFYILPKQTAYTYSNYKFQLTGIHYYSGDEDNDAGWYFVDDEDLGGYIEVDKATGERTLHFYGDVWMFLYDPMKGAGYFSYWFVPGADLTRDNKVNGLMEVDSYFEGESIYPVRLTQNGNIVTVDNFAGLGSVDIILSENGSLEVPYQFLCNYNNYYIYTYGANVTEKSWNFANQSIYGTGDMTQLTLGGFVLPALYENNDYVGPWDVYYYAKIYYVNGSCQRYNYSDPEVAASAPTFAFDGGATGIQNAKVGEVVSESYVDMAGRQVTAATKGIVLKTTTYADGTKKTVKVIRK